MTNQPGLSLFTRGVAILLAGFIILTAPASLMIFNFEHSAFDPATYQNVLIDQNFYQQFPALLSDLIVKNIGAGAPAFIQHITASQWQGLVEDLLSQQQLQVMTEDTLKQLLGFINDSIPSPNISLVTLKKSIGSPSGLKAVLTFISAQPECTIAQLEKLITSLAADLCKPPDQILVLIAPIIETQLQVAASTIPDELPLIPAPSSNSVQIQLHRIRLVRTFMFLSPLIPLVFLIGMTLVAVRTFKGWLIWWGWPMLLGGSLGSLISFNGAPFLRLIAEDILFRQLPLVVPLVVSAALRAFVDAALFEILKPAAWENLGLCLIGLAMILISIFTARNKDKRSEAGRT